MLINGDKLTNTLNVKRTLTSSKEEERTLNVNYYAKARYLVDKFKSNGCTDADNCFNYFVECFKKLTESTIWDLFEKATNNPKIKSPIKYFIASCRNQMEGKFSV